MTKRNVTYIVSIAWQSTIGGNVKTCLRTSIYFEKKDKVHSEDEALGKAITEQRKTLDNPVNFNMLVHNIASTWNEESKPDLSCLRYC